MDIMLQAQVTSNHEGLNYLGLGDFLKLPVHSRQEILEIKNVLSQHTFQSDSGITDYNNSIVCTKKGSFGMLKLSLRNSKMLIHKKQINWSTLVEVELAKFPKHNNILLGFNFTLDKINILSYYFYDDVSLSLDILCKHKSLLLEQTAHVMTQILFGLEYLQAKKIIHCNLTQKCLYVKENYIQIADFSFACISQYAECVGKTNLNFPYNGPDQIEPVRITFQTDVWAFGIVAAELLAKQEGFPFPIGSCEQDDCSWQLAQFKNCNIKETLFCLDVSARSILLQCLKVKASKRPTLAEIKKSEFLSATQLLFNE